METEKNDQFKVSQHETNSNYDSSFKSIAELNVRNSIENTISEHAFNSIGDYEKKFLLDIGKLINVFTDEKQIDFIMLKKLINGLSEGIKDNEKRYLLGLLFPEKITKGYYFSPLPIKTYTFKHQFAFTLDVSNKGNFLLQVKSPGLFDKANTKSDFMYCNNTNIGIKSDASLFSDSISGMWTKVKESQIETSLFSSYILLGMSIKVKYTGSLQDQAGRFGAGFTLSSQNVSSPDLAYVDFDIVRRTCNFVECPTNEQIKVVYYPPDNSFMEFRIPNEDSVSTNRQPLCHLISIFGQGLLTNNSSTIHVEVSRAFSCIPNARYTSILELDYMDQVKDMGVVRDFIAKNNIAVTTGDNNLESLENVPLDLKEIMKVSPKDMSFYLDQHGISSKINY